MLHKYASHFDALTSDQAIMIATRLHLPLDQERDLSGPDLFEICSSAELDQADVVMSLSDDFSLPGVRAIETLIGKPIQRQPTPPVPGAASPQRPTRPSIGDRRPARRQLAGDLRVITFVQWPCPKKTNSAPAGRYANYKIGQTVEEAVAAGLTLADVSWDSDPKRGFIRIAEPGTVVPTEEVAS